MSIAPLLPGRQQPFPNPLRSVHLIGICGSGMYPLAQALITEGVAVSGSDLDVSKGGDLTEKGACLYSGHSSENLSNPQVVVISTAIPESNPELQAARERGITVRHRSEMLGWFLARRESLLIAGTHGKTTTSAMMGLLLEEGGKDPSCFVGGKVREYSGNVRIGGGDFAVAEADESDGSFLNLPADHLLITNIEPEHMNYWQTEERLYDGFCELAASVPTKGNLVVCADDPGIQKFLGMISVDAVTWSLEGNPADYQVSEIELLPDGARFIISSDNRELGQFHLGVPGRHNVSNCAGAFALAHRLGVEIHRLGDALKNFRGVDRRFTRYLAPEGFLVIDDYAHHPTEITATMAAARQVADDRNGRLIAVFQPHRYTRIADLFDAFGSCFKGADEVVVLDIFSGGEMPIDGVTSERFYAKIKGDYDFPVANVSDIAGVEKSLRKVLKVGDTVLLLGAGSITKLANLLSHPC